MTTITVLGSGVGSNCLVPFGSPGEFIQGRRVNITIVHLEESEDVPLFVRLAMVGMTFSTVLTQAQIVEQCGSRFGEIILDGSRVAFAHEVVMSLIKAEKKDEAIMLQALLPMELDLYIFPRECYQEAGKE